MPSDTSTDRTTVATDEVIDFGDGSFRIRNRSDYRPARFKPNDQTGERSAQHPVAPDFVK